MKLTKQSNFEFSGVVAKRFSISVSKMNRVLAAGISFDGLWLVLSGNVTTGRFNFSISLKSRQKQKHPPSIKLEILCSVNIPVLIPSVNLPVLIPPPDTPGIPLVPQVSQLE